MRGVAEAGSRNEFCWLTNVNVTFFHGKPTKFHTGSLRRFAPWFWIESSCYARTLSPKLRLGRLSPPIAQDDWLKYYFAISLKKNRSLKRQTQKESLNTTLFHLALGVLYGGSALFGSIAKSICWVVRWRKTFARTARKILSCKTATLFICTVPMHKTCDFCT